VGVGLRVKEFFLDGDGVEVLIRTREIPDTLHLTSLNLDIASGVERIRLEHYEHTDAD